MKAFYTIALAALVAASAAAAPAVGRAHRFDPANKAATLRGNVRTNARTAEINKLRAENPSLRPMVAFAEADVVTPPAGAESQDYVKSGVGVVSSIFGMSIEELYSKSAICMDGNDVYIQNLVPGANGYVKGQLSADGKTISVQLPQVVAYEDYAEWGYDYAAMFIVSMANLETIEEDGEEYADYSMEEEAASNVVTFSVNDDGTLSGDFDFTGESFEEDGVLYYNLPARTLSSFAEYTDEPGEYYCSYNMLWNCSFKEFDLVPTQLPDGMQMEANWVVATATGSSQFVSVGFNGDDVYVAGLNGSYTPDAVIKGLVVGDKIVFNDQYVGYSDLYDAFVFMLPGKSVYAYDEEYDEYYWDVEITNDEGNQIEEVSFSYDAAGKRFWADADQAILFNIYPDELNNSVMDYYIKPEWHYVDPATMCAPVANPSFEYFDDYYYDSDGSYGLIWNVPTENVNGVMLNPDDMYYNMYINGELFTFYDDEYGLGGDITDVPLTIGYSYDLYYANNSLTVYVYTEGIETVGLQTFYRGVDGEVYHSDLITADVAGLDTLLADGKQVAATAYYDLNGRRVERPAQGIYVARYTFTDGSSRSAKVVVR